jgi:hypothetical protein
MDYVHTISPLLYEEDSCLAWIVLRNVAPVIRVRGQQRWSYQTDRVESKAMPVTIRGKEWSYLLILQILRDIVSTN